MIASNLKRPRHGHDHYYAVSHSKHNCDSRYHRCCVQLPPLYYLLLLQHTSSRTLQHHILRALKRLELRCCPGVLFSPRRLEKTMVLTEALTTEATRTGPYRCPSPLVHAPAKVIDGNFQLCQTLVCPVQPVPGAHQPSFQPLQHVGDVNLPSFQILQRHRALRRRRRRKLQ